MSAPREWTNHVVILTHTHTDHSAESMHSGLLSKTLQHPFSLLHSNFYHSGKNISSAATMSQKVVLITGCSSGIGLAIAVLMAKDERKRFKGKAGLWNYTERTLYIERN